jgi:hypothetical protein
MKMNVLIFPTRLNFDQRKRLPGRQLADDFCWQEAEVACGDREQCVSDWFNRFVVVGKNALSGAKALCGAETSHARKRRDPLIGHHDLQCDTPRDCLKMALLKLM